MPKQYSLNSLMDDVLREVDEAQSSQEKTASAEVSREMRSEYAQYVMKLAEELRSVSNEDVSYEDLAYFLEKEAGMLSAMGRMAKAPVIAAGRKIKDKAGRAVDSIKHGLGVLADKHKARGIRWENAARKFERRLGIKASKPGEEAAEGAADAVKKWKPWQIGAGVAGVGALGTGAFLGGRALAGKGDEE